MCKGPTQLSRWNCRRFPNATCFSFLQVNESVEVLVENVNDNPPNFLQNHYVLEVNEVSTVDFSRLWYLCVFALRLSF